MHRCWPREEETALPSSGEGPTGAGSHCKQNFFDKPGNNGKVFRTPVMRKIFANGIRNPGF